MNEWMNEVFLWPSQKNFLAHYARSIAFYLQLKCKHATWLGHKTEQGEVCVLVFGACLTLPSPGASIPRGNILLIKSCIA